MNEKVQGGLAVVEFLHSLIHDTRQENVTKESVLSVLESVRKDIQTEAGLSAMVDAAVRSGQL